MLVAGVVGLVLGYLALLLVNAGIGVIWDDIPASWESTPAWYIIGILLIAAVLVYVIRRFVGDAGHSPIGGITVSPLTPKDYVGAILAILASLWGGIVLGPEVALVATGSMVGTVTAKAMGFTDAANQKKIVELLRTTAQAAGADLVMVTHDHQLLDNFDHVIDLPTLIATRS